MKSTFSKILAILMAFTLVISFAACTGNDDTTTEPVSQVNGTTMGDTTAADTTSPTGENSTAPTDTTSNTGVNPTGTTGTIEPTTTKPPVIIAPIGTDIAKIVAFYNQYANATKAYKDKITVSGKQGTTTTINSLTAFFGSVPDSLRQKANEMVPNDYGPITTKTFKNGTQVGGTSTLKRTLPCDESDKMSTLEPAGVKSATCVKFGTGWKVSIVLIKETCPNLNDKPRYNSQCTDTVSLTAEDLDPFTLVSATVYYDRTTITAVVNPNGLLDSVDIVEPDHIVGVLKLGIKVNADVTGTWKQNLKFTY